MSISKHSINDLPSMGPEAVELAAKILAASRKRETRKEKDRSAMMARMMKDESGKKFTIAMADQVLRIKRPARAAERMEDLVQQYGVPAYFPTPDRMALRVGVELADWLPRWIMPQVKKKVRKDSQHVIISAEKDEFAKYLDHRKQNKIRVNFNQLGEAVLGEHEAERRLRDNIQRLKEPGVDYISIKLSAITSQISLTGYQQTIDKIKPRLRSIYQAAVAGGGANGPKFVNLDMEEYRDLDLTVSVFKAVLDEPEFDHFEAGIVLQAYLPDSFSVLQSLTNWAIERKSRTGTGIKIRLVKGANLAMEQVEASLEDWPQAPYHSKLEVDANYKRMLEFATRPEHAQAVRIGVGSHNLFDIALALLLREKRGVKDRIEFEMLEGMANAQSEEIRDRSGGMLLYSPVVLDAEFEAAIAYLVRRLDENTAPGSFLGALFALREGTPEWEQQKTAFLNACDLATSESLPAVANRNQNRITEDHPVAAADQPFHNESDTDFSLPQNREWIGAILADWKSRDIPTIPVQVAGELLTNHVAGTGHDPSRPGHQAYQYCHATQEDIDRALKTAVAAQAGWEARGREGRSQVLRQIAASLAAGRGESIGAMLVDAGKAIREADVEVSEAIDFASYYARSLDSDGWFDGTQATALGVVVITPPWNFPCAIPAGGILAALMAGNTVLLKPAPEAVLVAWTLVQQFWNAGVPQDVLQFVPTDDGPTGKSLICDPRVNAVILTGSIQTANLFQSWRPDLRLFAETSGKNAMIITSAADVDLAVKDLVRGAFGHAGQKCSATSLALVEQDVFDNPQFRQQLKDAAESLTIGGSWNPSAVVTPIIREADENLKRGLTELDEGESWLLEPKMIDGNPCLWSPGIRIGVRPGSWYHQTECFGPVLGIICVKNLEEAIAIQNSSRFGLTGGLHSLDPDEIDHWREKVQVGNAYVNRTTTGAIVRRQPFGGWKDSSVGPGSKAGGPNYVSEFSTWAEHKLPTHAGMLTSEARSELSRLKLLASSSQVARLTAAAESYAYWYEREFGVVHDPSSIHGENNEFRYRPRPFHMIRIPANIDPQQQGDLGLVALACQTVGTPLELSVDSKSPWLESFAKAARCRLIVETAEELQVRLPLMWGGSIRIWDEAARIILTPNQIGNLPVARSTVLANGRLELLNYLVEQSISETVHRYGNLFD